MGPVEACPGSKCKTGPVIIVLIYIGGHYFFFLNFL
jgi:hypothetical protein